ncbi:MAG: alpha,alpha-trehalose-phosphate synthase (UDP-forming) [Bacillota bacterium]
MSKNPIVMISNAEPYAHKYSDGKVIQEKQPGGLTTGLDPLMQESDDCLWVAWGRGEADFTVTDKNNSVMVPNEAGYKLKRIKLDENEQNGFYYGFSNQSLWPLCHNFITIAQFSPINWEMYKKVNKKYAHAALSEITGDEMIWVQDYQLSLVSGVIRDVNPEAKLAQFWHIPWPPAETFNNLPWRKEILHGLLANDIIGFHTDRHARNFIDSTRYNSANVKYEKPREENNDDHLIGIIEDNGHETRVIALPLGIDFQGLKEQAESLEIKQRAKNIKANHSATRLLVGVDRLDYTKGILERLKAIDKLLELHPEYIGEITLLQRIAPSRIHIEAYEEMEAEIDRAVGDINGRYQQEGWQPIVYFKGGVPQKELLPYFLAADAALITPLIDGLNLVSKEFLAINEGGQIILSEFAGAASQLDGAYLTNPYNIEETAMTIAQALGAGPVEKKERYEANAEIAQKQDIEWWRDHFFKEWEKCYE